MTHVDEDDLVLYFYGEARGAVRIARHLEACPHCAAVYADLAATLRMAALPMPERDDRYGLEVWQRIRPRLPAQGAFHRSPLWPLSRRTLAVAASALIAGSLVVGRAWRSPRTASPSHAEVAEQTTDASDRARIAAIADHLEESERMLLDFVNAGERVIDLNDQQASAAELLESNRLYRDAAALAGDDVAAGVLDELERSLLEIVHAPSRMPAHTLNDVRVRLGSAPLLLKVRVLAEQYRTREVGPPPQQQQHAT